MKIKKFLLIFIILLGLTACVNVNNLNIQDITNKLANESIKANEFRRGYEFFIPSGLSIEKAGTNYIILSSNREKYYVYIDMISYNAKGKIEHQVNNNIYFSKDLNYKGKTGFIDINLTKNEQYLVEIMYNYATIEVMVDKSSLNHVLINSINILNSIKYNDDIIKTLVLDDDLEYTEELFDIFEDVKTESNTLDVIEDNSSNNNNDNNEIKDTDYIN